MKEQTVRYHKRRLIQPRFDLFYWLWGGADVKGWFHGSKQLGHAARFGASEPTIDDEDEGDKIIDFRSESKALKCVECQKQHFSWVSASFDVEPGIIDHSIIGGRTVALPFVDIKTMNLLGKFRGGVFRESTKVLTSPKKYLLLHGTGKLASVPVQGLTLKDEQCANCGHRPIECATCGSFFNPCPICKHSLAFDEVAPPNASRIELMGMYQLYIDHWNGDDIIGLDAPIVTGRVIEALIEANVKLFFFGPVDIEFAGASAEQKKWADKAARRFF